MICQKKKLQSDTFSHAREGGRCCVPALLRPVLCGRGCVYTRALLFPGCLLYNPGAVCENRKRGEGLAFSVACPAPLSPIGEAVQRCPGGH